MTGRFLSIFSLALLLPLAGCNTVAGFGQDMQAAGAALRRSAQHFASEGDTLGRAEAPRTLSGSTVPPTTAATP